MQNTEADRGSLLAGYPLRRSIVPERANRLDPPCAQRRNQRRTCARRDDAEQGCGVGDRIEETHARADLLCRGRRKEHAAERGREAAPEEQPDSDGTSQL